MPHPVVVLNPLQVHAYQRSGIRKRKNDRIDSFWIADFARISNLQATPQQATEHLQLRDLSRFRFRLTENMGNCKRRILSSLDRVFPEYEKLFSNVFLTSSRQLLAQAVTAQELATRKAAGTGIELTGLLTLGWSPLWIFAARHSQARNRLTSPFWPPTSFPPPSRTIITPKSPPGLLIRR